MPTDPPLSKQMTAPGSDDVARPDEADVRAAYLVMLAGSNVGQMFALQRQPMTIGRDDDAEIQILDGAVSRRHAVITWDASQACFLLRDLGSRNGTRVDGVPLTGLCKLERGAKVQLGTTTVLRLSFGQELETQYAQKMYDAVLRDGLTGVFNRRYLDQRLSSEMAFAVRHRAALSLLLFDIDHFKSINDTFGHPCGDAVLQQMAQLVAQLVRSEDVLARYGGEEFAVVCRDTPLDDAARLAERLREAIGRHSFDFDDRCLKVTVSVGVAALDGRDRRSAKALVDAADQALYRAKGEGRNRVVRER